MEDITTQGIEMVASLFAHSDQPSMVKDFGMIGDCRLRHRKRILKRNARQLIHRRHLGNHAPADRITKSLEDVDWRDSRRRIVSHNFALPLFGRVGSRCPPAPQNTLTSVADCEARAKTD